MDGDKADGEGKGGYTRSCRKFGLAGPFLHGGRNRCSVYMCVARLIRRRCSLVWHGTLPRRDWSPIKVSATFILGQGERRDQCFSFSPDLLLLLRSHVTRIRDRYRTRRRTATRFRRIDARVSCVW